MTFLPIVQRELREAARRSGTYWIRMAVAFQATLAAVAAGVFQVVQPSVKFGAALFWGLAFVAMIHCLFAGRRSSADCLSIEKREGTMGLLFLTDLKAYDIVIGKLVATSLGGFYGLLAIFPVLAVPLLVGGMTNGELWRMLLTLIVTFGFTLSIGVLCSATAREYKEAIGRNFFVLTTVAVILPMVGLFMFAADSGVFQAEFFVACPFYCFALCSDRLYRFNALGFWASITVMHGLTWFCVIRACHLLPRAWQDDPAVGGGGVSLWKRFRRAITYGGAAAKKAFRKQALNANAYFWLAARERLKPAHVWAFLVAAALWWLLGWRMDQSAWLDETSDVTMALLLTATLKLWVIVEAGQRFASDREIGSMELLLCTPLTVGDYVRGQLLSLRRQFFKPAMVVLAALAALMSVAVTRPGNSGWFPWAAAAVLFAADLGAAALDAMWTGLTRKTHTRATLATVLRILVFPWVAYSATVGCYRLLQTLDYVDTNTMDTRFLVAAWLVYGLAADAYFGNRAWKKLHSQFREAALGAYGVRAARIRQPSILRRRPMRTKLAWGAVAAAMLGACLVFGHSEAHFPPPVAVTLTQSNAPLKAFRGSNGGMFFILPDGSLWRWGKPDGPKFPRASAPEPIGTNKDWQKVVLLPGPRVFGLRGNGSIWEWGVFPNGRGTNFPTQRNYEDDWKDIGFTLQYRVAMKRDGTLWAWGPPLAPNTNFNGRGFRSAQRVGNETNWARLMTLENLLLCVQSNGLVSAWGLYQGRFYNAPTAVASNVGAFNDDVLGVRTADYPQVTLRNDGTVWTQGPDPSYEPRISFTERVELAENKFKGTPTAKPRPTICVEPRPLMKLQR